MPSFSSAPPEVAALVGVLIERSYPDFLKTKLTYTITFAYASIDDQGEVTAPALSSLGVPVVSRLKICSPKDRVDGLTDVVFYLDSDYFNLVGQRAKDALLCDLLDSFRLQLDKEENPKSDDQGRPKLEKVPPDAVAVVRRKSIEEYGDDSPSARSLVDAGRVAALAVAD